MIRKRANKMSQIVIGNIIALIASLLMICANSIKNKKKTIFIQTMQIALFVVSNLVLGGYSGAIINTISCVRNIMCYKEKLGMKGKIILAILSVTFTLIFNNMGIIGLLPLISTVAYTMLMDIKDVVKFKYLSIFTLILWMIYDICIKSYTSAVFDFLSIIGCLVAIIQLKLKTKDGEKIKK